MMRPAPRATRAGAQQIAAATGTGSSAAHSRIGLLPSPPQQADDVVEGLLDVDAVLGRGLDKLAA